MRFIRIIVLLAAIYFLYEAFALFFGWIEPTGVFIGLNSLLLSYVGFKIFSITKERT